MTKKCQHDDCNTRANFGYDKPTHCSKHKVVDMTNLVSKKCQYNGCNTCATFGYDKPTHCSKHKDSDMTDLVSKKCQHDGCNTIASYNIPGHQAIFCTKHKNNGMVKNPTKKCELCNELAIYGIFIPERCEHHKKEDDINLFEQKCKKCNLHAILDENKICNYCIPQRSRLHKQNIVMDFLDKNGLSGFTTDTVIDNGLCGRERPDRVYDFNDKIIIIEVDEEQHKSRPCECEQTRMINIGQSFGGIPVYFIRYNPDKYKSLKSRNESAKKRLNLLKDLVTDIKDNNYQLPIGLVSVIYLYYDNFTDINDEQWTVLHKVD